MRRFPVWLLARPGPVLVATVLVAMVLMSTVLMSLVTPATAHATIVQAGPAPSSAGVSTADATPVLSLRRVPELLALAAAASKLDTQLDATLADTKLTGTKAGVVAASSCLVVQAGTTTIYSHNPSLPLLPASNLKLLTATAALDKLPANDQFVTTVRSVSPPSGGTVTGNLYLVGGGDPLLRTQDYVASLHYPEQIYDNLETLADQVRAAGVTHITGSVVGDESRYDTERSVPSWPARYLTSGQAGPLSALEVNDGFSAFKPALVPAPQPAVQAAATFSDLLEENGITITGAPEVGTAPAGAATITQLTSPPLSQVLDEILRQSDNTGAELITKELGRQANPATPTTAAGVAAIEADITADGLPTAGLHMADGSGLDRSDRVTCQLILATLQRSGPTGAIGLGLPIAGKTGTLFQRMIATPAAGRLRAKTGTLDGVSALSGFVLPPTGPLASATPSGSGVAFSLITNAAPNDDAGEALGDRVGELLAEFPQAPPISQLAPLPGP